MLGIMTNFDLRMFPCNLTCKGLISPDDLSVKRPATWWLFYGHLLQVARNFTVGKV